MSLGERIKKLRKRLGLTQKEFAGRVAGKVDYTYIGRMEREEQYPSLGEVKDLLKDRRKQDLLKMSQELNPRDLGLVIQIINILAKEKPLKGLYLAEPGPEYLSIDEEKRKDLIGKTENVLGSSPKSLSTQEDWLRETLQIALKTLKRSAG